MKASERSFELLSRIPDLAYNPVYDQNCRIRQNSRHFHMSCISDLKTREIRIVLSSYNIFTMLPNYLEHMKEIPKSKQLSKISLLPLYFHLGFRSITRISALRRFVNKCVVNIIKKSPPGNLRLSKKSPTLSLA